MKILEVTWMREVKTQGDLDDWMIDYGYRKMKESGGMGIPSDQSWNRRRMTMKFSDMEGVPGENPEKCWQMLDVATAMMDITMTWDEDWKQCLA